MSALFEGRTLLRNTAERDALDTEAELSRRLDNRLLLLFFGAAGCPRTRALAPVLRDFGERLTADFHVARAAQLALLFVSQDREAGAQRRLLRALPARWLWLPCGDPLRWELRARFGVEHLPAVVVLAPDGRVLSRDAAAEISRLGPACFANWFEAAELLDRNFLPREDFEDPAPRSLTEPLRRCKYRVAPEPPRAPEDDDDDGDLGQGLC